MENIIDMLRNKDNFHALNGVAEADIKKAEKLLNLTFATEYRDYLIAFGLASFCGHELTGITKSLRLDVVAQTIAEKNKNPHIPDDLYVIEIANIDGIVIWQKNTGEILKTTPNGTPVQIGKSLCNYITFSNSNVY